MPLTTGCEKGCVHKVITDRQTLIFSLHTPLHAHGQSVLGEDPQCYVVCSPHFLGKHTHTPPHHTMQLQGLIPLPLLVLTWNVWGRPKAASSTNSTAVIASRPTLPFSWPTRCTHKTRRTHQNVQTPRASNIHMCMQLIYRSAATTDHEA